MFQKFLKDIKKYSRYAAYSAKAKLKSEVANSYLNWLWWILEPLAFMLIYTLIFGVVFNAREPYFPVFIFIGLTMWNFFNKTMLQSVRIVKNNKAIVSKVYLPKYILSLVQIGVNGFKMCVSMVIVLGMLVFYKVPVNGNALYAVPILITFVLITFGASCFLLHYGVFIEDLTNVTNIVLRLIFYLTGIFYDVMKRIPAPYNAVVGKCNPIAFLLSSMRQCVLYGKTPGRKLLLAWFVFSLLLCMLGVRKIYKNENSYVKVI